MRDLSKGSPKITNAELASIFPALSGETVEVSEVDALAAAEADASLLPSLSAE